MATAAELLNFKTFLESLIPEKVIPSFYDENKSFIVLEVDLEKQRVKLKQENMPDSTGRWYSEKDFCRIKVAH